MTRGYVCKRLLLCLSVTRTRKGREAPTYGVSDNYTLVGNAFEDRRTRFDEAIQLLGSLLKQPFWRSTEG
jgi:hypothetical protein